MTSESTLPDAPLSRELDAAQVMLSEGRLAEAEVVLHGIIAGTPEHLEAMRLLAHAALARGNAGQAIDWLNRAATLDRNHVPLLLDLGIAYRMAERPDAARYVLERVLELTSGRELTARLLLAHVLELDNRPELALLHYFRAILDAQQAGRWHGDESTEPGLRSLVQHAMSYVGQARRTLLDAALQPLRMSHESASLDRVQRALAIYLHERNEPRGDPRQRPRILYVPGLDATPIIDPRQLHWLDGLMASMADTINEINRCLDPAPIRETDKAAFSMGEMPAPNPQRANPAAVIEHETPLYVAGNATEWAQRNAPHLLACLTKAPLAQIPHYGPEVSVVSISPLSHTPVRYGRTNAYCSVAFNLQGSERIEVKVGASAYALNPGESLVFDPSFGVAYSNEGKVSARLVVFDIWHPQLSALERDGLKALIQAIVDFDTRLQELA